MDELITKAQHDAAFLVGGLMEAHRIACRRECDQPAGLSRGDKALIAYLAERLAVARKLESDLLNL